MMVRKVLWLLKITEAGTILTNAQCSFAVSTERPSLLQFELLVAPFHMLPTNSAQFMMHSAKFDAVTNNKTRSLYKYARIKCVEQRNAAAQAISPEILPMQQKQHCSSLLSLPCCQPEPSSVCTVISSNQCQYISLWPFLACQQNTKHGIQ